MTKFNKFDRKNLKNLRAEMDAVLKKYGTSANLDIALGNMKFSDSEVTIKVEAKIKGAKTMSNVILDSRVAALGVKMKNKAGDELVDYNTRAYKMPFVYRSSENGKLYKASEDRIRLLFAA